MRRSRSTCRVMRSEPSQGGAVDLVFAQDDENRRADLRRLPSCV